MKTALLIILSLLSIHILVSCKSSRVLSPGNQDQFLIVVVKNEPGVIQGLLESCSCFEIITMNVVQVEPILFDFTGNTAFPVTTVRLLIKIKQENNSDYVLGQLLRMKEVVSINFK